MTLPWPYSTEDAEFFVRSFVPENWASGAEATWAVRRRGSPETLVGMVSLRSPLRDVGYWLSPDSRGNGYMSEALKRVVEWAQLTGFGVTGFGAPGLSARRALTWSCIAGNAASAAVARRSGFRYAGEGPSPSVMRDGSRPLSWLGEYTGIVDPEQWPPFTFVAGAT